MQLASLVECLQGMELTDAPDERLLTLSGKPYTSRSAYAALDQVTGTPDAHGRHIWTTRVPNKVKIFAWLYFKDRLSIRTNLFAKHILDDESCQRCSNATEDRLHVFFGCPTSAELWESTALLSDTEVWSANVPSHLDTNLWPFVLLTILWRIWDARNGETFRNEPSTSRRILSKVCDDLVIWRKRLKLDSDVINSRDWHIYLLSCNSTKNSI